VPLEVAYLGQWTKIDVEAILDDDLRTVGLEDAVYSP